MKQLLIILFSCLVLKSSFAQTEEYRALNVYGEIDVERHNKAINIFKSQDKNLRLTTLNEISGNYGNYNPPALYAAAREAYSAERKYQAAFLYYLAQLRARVDAYLCLDNSVFKIVTSLNNVYGPEINRFSFEHTDSLQAIITRVIQIVKADDAGYDHRWIALHGNDYVSNGDDPKITNSQIIEPKEKWQQLKQEAVQDYYDGFMTYLNKKKR